VDAITAPGQRRIPRYERAARRIAYAAALGALAQVTLGAAAGYIAGRLFESAVGIESRLIASALAIIAGGVLAHHIARRMSRIIGASVARPIEMIVTHLAACGDDIIDQFHAPKCRRLNAGRLLADEAFLRARFAAAEERTRELIAQLENARTQATMQNAAKSQFLAGMSHELRTPLNAILGYAMLLQEDANAAGNTGAIADLERIAVAGRHLLTLINNVLDLSRLDTGKMAINKAAIDVNAMLAAVSSDVVKDLAAHGGTLAAFPSADVCVLPGDGSKVAQCLGNLVRYAATVGPGREIRLDVARTAGTASGATAEFTVWAWGVETMPAVPVLGPNAIEPFARELDPATLGLQIARHMARLMDGDVDVMRTPDGQPRLRLSLPLNASGNADYVSEHAKDEAVVQDETLYGDADALRCALVIDDNPEALDLMRRWLGKLGYAVAVAADGEQGLAMAAARKFDVIMLDVFMPGRSGYEVLDELRAAAMTSDTPIIMCTVDDDRARALSAGATDHVRKPVSEEQMRSLLQTYREPITGDLLVIDANDVSAELVKRCARQVGFATRRAVSRAEGLALARASRPSAVVFDLATSRSDGVPALEALLADGVLAGVPVVILASGEISPDAHRWIEQAGYRFLPKGAYFPREIAAKLKELVA